jgi:acyl-CoA synthetase (AMP-forming)/AMP-acid ligase II
MKTLADLWTRNARVHRSDIALVCGGRQYTYATYAERCWRLAAALKARSVVPPARIAILGRNSAELLEAYGAAEAAGYIAVPLNWRLAPAELAAVFRDCEPVAILFAAPEFSDTVAALGALIPAHRVLIAWGEAPGWAEPWECVLAAAPSVAPETMPTPDDIAALIYTSGTTGRPKGVMLSHRGQVATAEAMALECEVRADDRHLMVMPLFHVGAKCKQLGYAWRGAAIHLEPRFDPARVLEVVERERITALHLAPVMVQMLLDAAVCASANLGSVHTVHYASAPMPVAHLRRAVAAFGPIFQQFYGMTESPLATVLRKPEHQPLDAPRLASAGRPIPSAEVRVVGSDGTDRPIGEPGEVFVRSDALMAGYWNQTAATLEALAGGWMHTGDIGRFDEEGYLHIIDRKKDMLISGGENIYPREVEDALMQHPAVAEAAVIGIPDPKWGEAVKAFVVLKLESSVAERELITHCRSLIAGYKCPRSVELVRDLPRVGTGKVDRRKLRQVWSPESDRQIS